MKKVIATRHPAALEFIARELGGEIISGGGVLSLPLNVEQQFMAIVARATANDVRGKHVYGNLPMHLAAVASKVTVIEFTGDAPRGAEYNLAEMDAAGAVLRSYVVERAFPDKYCQRCGGAGYASGEGLCHGGPYVGDEETP